MSEDTKVQLNPYRWVILAIMWSTTFIGVAAQFQVAALAYKIIPGFKFTNGQYAMVFSAPMLAGVFFSLTAGAMADRFGVKRIITVGFAFTVVGIFFRYAAHDFIGFFILTFYQEFNYFSTGISVRDGGSYFEKADKNMLDPARPFLMCIEDPHDESTFLFYFI